MQAISHTCQSKHGLEDCVAVNMRALASNMLRRFRQACLACLFSAGVSCALYSMQMWEAIGGTNVFRSGECHNMLKEHSEEVRGATLPNFVGDRVFNGIFAERKPLLSHYLRCETQQMNNLDLSCQSLHQT